MIRVLLSLVLLVTACDPEYLDNGLMVRDGLTLHECVWPINIQADETFDEGVLADAVENWNTWLGVEAFVSTDTYPVDAYASTGYVPVDQWNPDEPDQGEAGLAVLDYDETGCIRFCDITVSSDITYHRPTYQKVTEHEMGHCLGLDDDPGPPVTVDLRSVMAKPIDILGECTSHDRGLVLEYF